MRQRTARLLRKFCLWAGVKETSLQRQRRRAWQAMSHKERGKARKRILRAVAKDPRPTATVHAPQRERMLK